MNPLENYFEQGLVELVPPKFLAGEPVAIIGADTSKIIRVYPCPSVVKFPRA